MPVRCLLGPLGLSGPILDTSKPGNEIVHSVPITYVAGTFKWNMPVWQFDWFPKSNHIAKLATIISYIYT